ncbi:mechanosensitive ion channel family protein [Geofilum rubicundum]|nr:mechanosensitive ion channel domain-containing protein [Geofilum rubicundum]
MKSLLFLLLLFCGLAGAQVGETDYERNPLIWHSQVDTLGVKAVEMAEDSEAVDAAIPSPAVIEKNDSLGVKGDTLVVRLAEADSQLKSATRPTVDDMSNAPSDVLQVISFSKIFWTLVILLIAYLFIRLLMTVLEAFAEKSAKARITIKSLIPVVRILIWSFILFAIVKGIYNPPVETLLALGASVAIAVGLAAQDLLRNVFGGIMLLFDRPFKVGDKIQIGQHYGEVLEIGLRATRLVTPDDSVVSVPNLELMNASVSNANSGELNCQVVAEIILPIDVDTRKVRKIATEAAQVSKFIYLNKPIVVLFFNEMHERKSYLKMRLKAYVMDIRYEFQFKSDMTEIVLKELLEQGLINKDDLGYK